MADDIMAENLRLRAELAAARKAIAGRDRQLDASYAGLVAVSILLQQLDSDVHLIQHRVSSATLEQTGGAR